MLKSIFPCLRFSPGRPCSNPFPNASYFPKTRSRAAAQGQLRPDLKASLARRIRGELMSITARLPAGAGTTMARLRSSLRRRQCECAARRASPWSLRKWSSSVRLEQQQFFDLRSLEDNIRVRRINTHSCEQTLHSSNSLHVLS